MDYGKTLHLPETDFPMRGNLPKREPEILKFWYDNKVYEKRLEKREGCKPFVLHDGPPYANGKLHIGHAMNKTLKDIIMKYKTLQGYYTPYIPGWDTHGLPIEHAVIKNTGLNRHEMSPLDLRAKCKEYALQCVEDQKKDFIRFGVLGRWENPYLTLRPAFEVKQLGIFGEMAKRGHIYKGLKTVYWCTHCETALAEAEIEYKEKKSFSIYVKYAYLNEVKRTLPENVPTDKAYAVIWTTTPWTIPASQAISVNPDLEYSWVQVGDEYYLMARELVESALKDCGVEAYTVLNTFSGADLELATFKHPFKEREIPVLLGDHVTLEAGTGCVHTAPAHGEDDFYIFQRYAKAGKIDSTIASYVDKVGCYTPAVDDGRYGDTEEALAGKEIHDAEVPVIKILAHNGALLQKGTLRHQYAHCWRCKNPVIYRATEQWFSSLDGYRKEALDTIDNQVQWIPKWGHDRIYNMVAERGDWCISRQRAWGVPIPVFYCKHCGEYVVNDETIASVQKLVAKEGSDAWWAHTEKELLPEGFTCPHCGHDEFRKESDIMDVWFDSGSSHMAVAAKRPELSWPVAMYLEGSDQHRGWFQSSLLTSVAVAGRAPYESVLTHGYVVDGDGRKMSKSVGNVIVPQDVIKQYGADIIRLWTASSDYKADIRISPKILKQLAEVYRKIRNTIRYILGNTNDFNYETDAVPFNEMLELDQWALMHLQLLKKEVTAAYESYDFHVLYHAIHNFCTVEMSSFYLDILKDRLYAYKADSKERRSAQTAMHEILMDLIVMLSPVLSFTMEEVWQFMKKPANAPESVQMLPWPEVKEEYINEELETKWDNFIEIRSEITKVLELARRNKQIGHSLDAKVELHAEGEALAILKSVEKDLATLLIVSQAVIVEGAAEGAEATGREDLKVTVAAAEGHKCERCWIYSDEVGQDAEHPTLCKRCAEAVKA